MIRLALALLLATPAAAEPSRILALGGSVTEIVYLLGQQDRLVARDSTSTFPPEALGLPDIAIFARCRPRGCCRSTPT